MALISSISGIRGTIGGAAGSGLTPVDIVKYVSAYAKWIKTASGKKNPLVVVGRDARRSGPMVDELVCGTLMSMGINVLNIGLATTPTTEIAVTIEKADGGIILTASHNPDQWNALKLLNGKGEFLSAADGEALLKIINDGSVEFANIDEIGSRTTKPGYAQIHIDEVLKLPMVNVQAIKNANFRVAIDCVNSVGGLCIPELLKELGVEQIIKLYCEPNGYFPHNPEPLPENLTEISEVVKSNKADVGFVVDPDVDRLAIVCEDGTMFGEEYTLVAVADYILTTKPGNTVSNLSSSRALRDITRKHGGIYNASAVGEVNVVEKMKATNAVIGGEGNGGVIYPDSHYGRDALVGIALFLSYLAEKNQPVSEIRKQFSQYVISKNKLDISDTAAFKAALTKIIEKYSAENEISTIDGVKIDFPEGWVHLRQSNTEPIVRVYAEAETTEKADELAIRIINDIKRLI